MPQVQKFVQEHPAEWAAWLHSYQQAQRPYQALARFDCPPPGDLQSYYWRQLPTAQQQRLTAHLQVCTSCATELQSLVSFLGQEAAQESPAPSSRLPTLNFGAMVAEFKERVRTVVATFMPPLLPELAPVAFRTDELIPRLQAEKPATLLFTAEDIDISLVAMQEVDGQIFLSGQVLSDVGAVAGKVKLTAEKSQRPTLEAGLDETGAFVINNLHPGYYQLTVTTAERAVIVPNVLLQA